MEKWKCELQSIMFISYNKTMLHETIYHYSARYPASLEGPYDSQNKFAIQLTTFV